MNYGTYSTIDCPTQKLEEAHSWLIDKFSEIGGTVRKLSNPHEFGNYPSFEIDYPSNVEDAKDFIDLGEDDPEVSEEELNEKQGIVDDWIDKANEIEAVYNKKFSAYL
jgi:hypothetical protein